MGNLETALDDGALTGADLAHRISISWWPNGNKAPWRRFAAKSENIEKVPIYFRTPDAWAKAKSAPQKAKLFEAEIHARNDEHSAKQMQHFVRILFDAINRSLKSLDRERP